VQSEPVHPLLSRALELHSLRCQCPLDARVDLTRDVVRIRRRSWPSSPTAPCPPQTHINLLHSRRPPLVLHDGFQCRFIPLLAPASIRKRHTSPHNLANDTPPFLAHRRQAPVNAALASGSELRELIVYEQTLREVDGGAGVEEDLVKELGRKKGDRGRLRCRISRHGRRVACCRKKRKEAGKASR
jgi:hypothetical protein